MRLTIFNGSPRGKKGNTRVLLDHFIEGFETVAGNSYDLFYLNRLKQRDSFVEAFANAETVLLAHPLYTDAMPGLVKGFIEALEPLCGRENNPAIGFILQSGFGEAAHSRYVERYYAKLSERLGCKHLGTAIKGNCQQARFGAKMYLKVYEEFHQLGKSLGETASFDEALVRKMAQPERFPAWMRLIFQLVWKTKAGTSLWDDQLRANNAYEQRFARPYAE